MSESQENKPPEEEKGLQIIRPAELATCQPSQAVAFFRHHMEDAIEALLPNAAQRGVFWTNVETAIGKNESIKTCTPVSIRAALVGAANLNLDVSGRNNIAALVPRGGQCMLDISYGGWQLLAERTGKIRSLNAQVVSVAEFEQGRFRAFLGSDQRVEHEPLGGDHRIKSLGDVYCAYSIATYVDGRQEVEFVTAADIRKISTNKPAWKEYPGEMARKTATNRHAKRLPLRLDNAWSVALEMTADLEQLEASLEPQDSGAVSMSSLRSPEPVEQPAEAAPAPEPESPGEPDVVWTQGEEEVKSGEVIEVEGEIVAEDPEEDVPAPADAEITTDQVLRKAQAWGITPDVVVEISSKEFGTGNLKDLPPDLLSDLSDKIEALARKGRR